MKRFLKDSRESGFPVMPSKKRGWRTKLFLAFRSFSSIESPGLIGSDLLYGTCNGYLATLGNPPSVKQSLVSSVLTTLIGYFKTELFCKRPPRNKPLVLGASIISERRPVSRYPKILTASGLQVKTKDGKSRILFIYQLILKPATPCLTTWNIAMEDRFLVSCCRKHQEHWSLEWII